MQERLKDFAFQDVKYFSYQEHVRNFHRDKSLIDIRINRRKWMFLFSQSYAQMVRLIKKLLGGWEMPDDQVFELPGGQQQRGGWRDDRMQLKIPEETAAAAMARCFFPIITLLIDMRLKHLKQSIVFEKTIHVCFQVKISQTRG